MVVMAFPTPSSWTFFFLQIGEQKSSIKMCRKSIFDDSFCVKVPPNVFHLAKCLFIRPVSVNLITSCDRTPRGHRYTYVIYGCRSSIGMY